MSKPAALLGLRQPSPALAALLLCALGFGLDQVELQMSTALATIFSARPSSLSPPRLAWLLSAIYVGGSLGTPLLGRVADRLGPGRVLCWTLVWLGLTSLLSCLRDDPTWLTGVRVLIGISLGAYPPLMITYLTSIAPEGQRGKWIFWACGLAYIATPIALFALRSLTAWHPAGVAGWRWLAAGIGALAVIVGYLFRSLPQPAEPRTESSGASRRGAVSLLMKAPLRRTFALVAGLYCLCPWALVAFSLLTGPLLLQRGFTLSNTLWYVSFATAWPVVGTLAAAWGVDRIPRRTAMLSCCVLTLIAALGFFACTTQLWLSVALVGFGIAQALYPAVMTTLGAESFPSSLRATATSAAWGLSRVATFLVPVALLPLLKYYGPTSVAVCVAGALILSVGVTSGFGRTAPAVAEGHSRAIIPPGPPATDSVGR
jgi:MFS transporter, putative metabolite:H+ symporter